MIINLLDSIYPPLYLLVADLHVCLELFLGGKVEVHINGVIPHDILHGEDHLLLDGLVVDAVWHPRVYFVDPL